MHSTGRNSSLFVPGRAGPNSPEGTPAPRIEMNNFKGMQLTEPSLSATGKEKKNTVWIVRECQ